MPVVMHTKYHCEKEIQICSLMCNWFVYTTDGQTVSLLVFL